MRMIKPTKPQIIEAVMLLGVFILFGFVGSVEIGKSGGTFMAWWESLVIPAMVLGIFRYRRTGDFLKIAASTGSAWIIVSFVQDARTGFRVSPRIAGVMSLPSSLLVYFIMGLIAAVIGGLSAFFGKTLRDVNQKVRPVKPTGEKPPALRVVRR